LREVLAIKSIFGEINKFGEVQVKPKPIKSDVKCKEVKQKSPQIIDLQGFNLY
jgi:hypothetical protein